MRRPSNTRPWTFVYVASLDNDLDVYSDELREQLQAGVQSSGVAVSLLVDDGRADGLRRVAMTSESTKESLLLTEDSTEVRTLEEFLQWTSWVLPADRYVLTFIGHGGRLDEIGRDDHHAMNEPSTTAWMSASEVGFALRRWDDTCRQGCLELLFLEQCGRASIESLYSFAGAAELILASDTVVYCPGTHYSHVFAQLALGQRGAIGFCYDMNI